LYKKARTQPIASSRFWNNGDSALAASGTNPNTYAAPLPDAPGMTEPTRRCGG
jgi:hypothetical protein